MTLAVSMAEALARSMAPSMLGLGGAGFLQDPDILGSCGDPWVCTAPGTVGGGVITLPILAAVEDQAVSGLLPNQGYRISFGEIAGGTVSVSIGGGTVAVAPIGVGVATEVVVFTPTAFTGVLRLAQASGTAIISPVISIVETNFVLFDDAGADDPNSVVVLHGTGRVEYK